MPRLIKWRDLEFVFYAYLVGASLVLSGVLIYYSPDSPPTCYTGQVLEVHSADKLAERAGRDVVSLELVEGGLFAICWK